MARVQVLVAAAVVACSGQASHFRLQVASSSSTGAGQAPTVTMQAGETRLVRFMVVGEVPESVTFSATGLPSFASLTGPLLTLSPARSDAGETVVTVTASAGSESASASLRVVVERGNKPPLWHAGVGDHYLLRDDAPYNQGYHHVGICPGPSCTLVGTPRLLLELGEPDGDAINVEVEVVVRGQAFSRKATHIGRKEREPGAYSLYELEMPLTGLTTDQSYDFAIRVTDEFGASYDMKSSDGWVYAWGLLPFEFDLGPCTTHQCACLPAGAWADGAPECCSGAADPGGWLPGFVDWTCR